MADAARPRLGGGNAGGDERQEAVIASVIERLRELLRARGWILRRAPGGGSALTLHDARGRRLCAFHARAAPPEGLAYRHRLVARREAGWRPGDVETRAFAEVRAALGAILETSAGGRGGGSEAPARSETHDGHGGRDHLLRTTRACNQRCGFCFVPLDGRRVPLAALSEELGRLRSSANAGRSLTISGGEPTTDSRLLPILSLARRAGFDRFVLQTNGTNLARGGLLARLVSAGARTYLYSFHSHLPEVYDAITGSRGQFARAVEGLRALLRERDCDTTINVVVCSLNVRHLPELVAFLSGLRSSPGPLRRPGLCLSMINEAGHALAPKLSVAIDEATPYLSGAARACRALDFNFVRSGRESAFPPCAFRPAELSASRRRLSQDRIRYGGDFSGAAGAVGRAKADACRACIHDSRCAGVPATYARLHGLGGLHPVAAP